MPHLSEAVQCTASTFSHWSWCASLVCAARRWRLQHTGVGPCDRCHREAALTFLCRPERDGREVIHDHATTWTTNPRACHPGMWSVVCEECAQPSLPFGS